MKIPKGINISFGRRRLKEGDECPKELEGLLAKIEEEGNEYPRDSKKASATPKKEKAEKKN